ncbi:hypothetical protein RF55_22811 [Lasius niger]|uniref:Uncharacterized protein n=1 Tax=Lasius niger TaxID=67767 RepID=A0A0J7JX31_LASNI|nr:hypothetical protein RF55_22811 [Lasius niger]
MNQPFPARRRHWGPAGTTPEGPNSFGTGTRRIPDIPTGGINTGALTRDDQSTTCCATRRYDESGREKRAPRTLRRVVQRRGDGLPDRQTSSTADQQTGATAGHRPAGNTWSAAENSAATGNHGPALGRRKSPENGDTSGDTTAAPNGTTPVHRHQGARSHTGSPATGKRITVSVRADATTSSDGPASTNDAAKNGGPGRTEATRWHSSPAANTNASHAGMRCHQPTGPHNGPRRTTATGHHHRGSTRGTPCRPAPGDPPVPALPGLDAGG